MIKKLLLIILLFSLTGCVNKMGAGELLDVKIDNRIDEIKKLQESDKQPNGKYKERAWETVDGVKYKVDEYEKPDGEVGYWITVIKDDNTGTYQKVIKKNDTKISWQTIIDKTIDISKSTSTK